MKCSNCGKEMKSKIRDYEYVESGLKNVILKNIRIYECKECGETLPEIKNVKQIHAWITEYLLRKNTALKGEEFRFLRKEMAKSAAELGQLFGVSPVTISRWENNKEKIGPQSDRLIRMLAIAGPTTQPAQSATRLLGEIFTTFLALGFKAKKSTADKIIITFPLKKDREILHVHE